MGISTAAVAGAAVAAAVLASPAAGLAHSGSAGGAAPRGVVASSGTAITGSGSGSTGSTGRAAATATVCSTAWGSLGKAAGTLSTAPLTGIRAGQHACFDRLVFDLRGPRAAYRIRYVDAVRDQGQGAVVPLRGGAFLQVDLLHPAYDEQGRATYVPADRREVVPVQGYRTLRQVAWGGSFEGYTTVGVGVRARLPFRAFALPTSTGTRLVLDVAHTW